MSLEILGDFGAGPGPGTPFGCQFHVNFGIRDLPQFLVSRQTCVTGVLLFDLAGAQHSEDLEDEVVSDSSRYTVL